jgi:hypothetical protein
MAFPGFFWETGVAFGKNATPFCFYQLVQEPRL